MNTIMMIVVKVIMMMQKMTVIVLASIFATAICKVVLFCAEDNASVYRCSHMCLCVRSQQGIYGLRYFSPSYLSFLQTIKQLTLIKKQRLWKQIICTSLWLKKWEFQFYKVVANVLEIGELGITQSVVSYEMGKLMLKCDSNWFWNCTIAAMSRGFHALNINFCFFLVIILGDVCEEESGLFVWAWYCFLARVWNKVLRSCKLCTRSMSFLGWQQTGSICFFTQ